MEIKTGGVWHPEDIKNNQDAEVIIVVGGSGLTPEQLTATCELVKDEQSKKTLLDEAKSQELLRVKRREGVRIFQFNPNADFKLTYQRVIEEIKQVFSFFDEFIKHDFNSTRPLASQK